MNSNTGMGVEEDERVEERAYDGYAEREESVAEPAEREESVAEHTDPEESQESETPREPARFDEADESDEADEGAVNAEPAAWSDPAEPYIGPGLATEEVAEEVAETEPESAYESVAAEEAAPVYEPTPDYQADDVPAAGSEYSERMREIQLEFIDDPRQAARDADGLIEDLLRGLTADLERRRSDLSTGMLSTDSQDEAPPTEDLRVAVQRSRELVDLLAQARERALL